MKNAPALAIYFATLRNARGTIMLLFADCYTITLASGAVLAYTNIEVPVVLGGVTFVANSVLIEGLKYKSSVGLDTDSQQTSISAIASDTIAAARGAPILAAIAQGAFDGATVQRDRVFFSDRLGGTQVGSVTLFYGRVATVDQVGRTVAKITVKSLLVLLDIDMPRNLYQPSCLHALYDAGCTLAAASFATSGTAGAGSTPLVINWSGALAVHTQGRVVFTSGANAGLSGTTRSVAAATSFTLRKPLLAAPALGDTFTIYQGCDHTQPTCTTQFSNLVNFRAFPFVPPPETAI